jgi:predicted Rossmann fold flavoprotein
MEETDNHIEDKVYDLVVIGGGAAGLMAAGTAAREGNSVLLLEKMEKTARKVNITGKGRCNLTNMCEVEEFLEKIRVNRDFFAPSLRFFSVNATCRFFERQGVKLEVEQGRRVFPKSGKAYDIADALRYWAKDNGAEVMLNARAEEILTAAGRVYGVSYTNKRGFRRKVEARNVLLTTGGASYPSTGSAGDGYRLAHRLGHSIVEIRPSLVPLVSSSPLIEELRGVRLKNVRATLVIEGEAAAEEFGEMDFGSRGLEGSLILRLSRMAVDALIDEKRVELHLDLKPALSEEILTARIERETESMPPDGFYGELLRRLLPRPMVNVVAQIADMNPKSYISRLTESETARLIATMKRLVIPISDYGAFEEAVVTAGGVDVGEIDALTLQSKLIKGLYFAGEVLDLDADTGGYNLQIAFSTGRLAAQLKT